MSGTDSSLNILEPCILCRHEQISVGNKLCSIHLKEALTEVILNGSIRTTKKMDK